jgi:hypothetical protein
VELTVIAAATQPEVEEFRLHRCAAWALPDDVLGSYDGRRGVRRVGVGHPGVAWRGAAATTQGLGVG